MTSKEKKSPTPIQMGLLYRFSDDEQLLKVKSGEKDYTKEKKKVIKVLRGKGLQPDNRQKIISKKFDGTWWAECDDQNIVHVFLISNTFPGYLAGELIGASRSEVAKVNNYYNETPDVLKAEFGAIFEKLIEKYNDPKNDALMRVNAKVEQAKTKMEENLQIALENTQDLEVIFFYFSFQKLIFF